MNRNATKISRNANIVRMRVVFGDTWKEITTAHGVSTATARAVVERYHKHVHTQTHSRRFGKPNEDRK